MTEKSVKKSPVEIPDLQSFLKAGVQFGHEKKRWNPKMQQYIFGDKKGIHVIDLVQTVSMLEEALQFLVDASRQGSVLFAGSKRQASTIIKEEAVRGGAHFIDHRWPGGLMTNFGQISHSLKKLRKMEEEFENGVEGRTKYEVSKMKDDWARLDRLYGGVKSMTRLPKAVVVIDPRYEIGAVVEANKLGIPVVALTDTNCDPDHINYVVPGNDDALGSIELFMKLFTDAILVGNGGQGVKHNLRNYSKVEVKLVKRVAKTDEPKQATPQRGNRRPAPAKSGKVRIKNRSNAEVKEVKLRGESGKQTAQKIEIPKITEVKAAPKKTAVKTEKKAEVKTEKKSVELSPRIEKALEAADLTVAKAQKMSKEELVEIKGLGAKAVEEILETK